MNSARVNSVAFTIVGVGFFIVTARFLVSLIGGEGDTRILVLICIAGTLAGLGALAIGLRLRSQESMRIRQPLKGIMSVMCIVYGLLGVVYGAWAILSGGPVKFAGATTSALGTKVMYVVVGGICAWIGLRARSRPVSRSSGPEP